MRLDNGSTTPVRIVPHSSGRSEDDDGAIDARALGAVTPEGQQLETTEADEPPHAQADADEIRATPEQIDFHPFAEIFPLIVGPEFDVLVSDITKHGQFEPIVLFEDKILDGRNRYRACVAAGVDPQFEPYQGDDPLGFVLSRNVRRRHLDESQRALVAAKLETMDHGGNRKAGQDANLHVDRSAAAKMLNVSERSVASAAKVLAEGEGELVRAVEQAKIKVSAAARATKLNPESQHQVAEKALAGDAKAARTILAKALREAREADLDEKQTAAPGKKYEVVVIDLESMETEECADDNRHPTCALGVVKQRIASIASADCVLFFWASPPRLAQALDAMKALGFEYLSNCIWVKDGVGTDPWFVNQHEILLIGARGTVPTVEPETRWQSLIDAPCGEHSARPEIFLDLIEEYFPTRSKIHLNRRGRPRAGWDDGADAEAEADDREA